MLDSEDVHASTAGRAVKPLALVRYSGQARQASTASSRVRSCKVAPSHDGRSGSIFVDVKTEVLYVAAPPPLPVQSPLVEVGPGPRSSHPTCT